MIDSLSKEYECPDMQKRWPLLNASASLMREAAQGHARYEALRKVNLLDFTELWKRNMAGENFDCMVDELVKAKNEPK